MISFLIIIFPRVASAKTPRLVRHAGRDIVSTFASWPVLVLVAGAGTAAMLTQVDTPVKEYFRGGRKWGEMDTVFSYLGEPYVLGPAALLTYGYGRWTHADKIAVTGETLSEALLFSNGVTGGLKFAFDRKRPNGGDYSFPSSHASTAFAVATVLETLHGPRYGVPAYLIAGAIGFSRIDCNVHYLSDVVFGAALGSAIGWGTARFHKKENTNLFIMPVAGKVMGATAFYRF